MQQNRKVKQNEVVSKNIFLHLLSSRDVRRPKSGIGPSSEASLSRERSRRQRMVARCSLPNSSEHLLDRKLGSDTPHVLALLANNIFPNLSGTVEKQKTKSANYTNIRDIKICKLPISPIITSRVRKED